MSVREAAVVDPTRISTPAGQSIAVLRIATGLLFLWAFADKAFGWGYATPSAKAWISGGSPTEGFLSGVHSGPFAETLRGWAGAWWADWLFMAGLLGIGVALVLGIGLRIAAVTGTLMMLMMWVAEWPPARFTDTGEATRSTNPVIEYHLIYALVLIVLAAVYAGHTWGLGHRWAQIAGDKRWLL
ncbi:DoxX family protein [Amycolatopsis magusensis]|uniref:DoxX family protein n=1 Tax=Amycolatopsis magusensis TaxID=882444 RepID=UPI0024A838C3|nr:DoxX family membrane protein [Amycolatopsis magusensis]MDI5975900.1 DoxX family membrane protein [Amycolatopsis magusensis]